MLGSRLITGSLLIAALIALIWVDDRIGAIAALPPGVIIYIVGLLVIALAAKELAAIIGALNIAASAWLMGIASAASMTCLWLVQGELDPRLAAAVLATVFAAAMAAGLLVHTRGRRVEGVPQSVAMVVLAALYPGALLGFLLAIRAEHTAWWLVGIVLTIKSCDIGAYFTGRAVGRRKLIVWLSPGKTWEGLVGGVALATVVGSLMAWASTLLNDPNDHVPIWWGAVCGVAFALVGQFGDLTMSLMKRAAKVKDTGRILPGMGGILDVMDSPIMVAPVAYWMLVVV